MSTIYTLFVPSASCMTHLLSISYLLSLHLFRLICYIYVSSVAFVTRLLYLCLIYIICGLPTILVSKLSILSTFFVVCLLSVPCLLYLYYLWLVYYLYLIHFICVYSVCTRLSAALSAFAISIFVFSILFMSMSASISAINYKSQLNIFLSIKELITLVLYLSWLYHFLYPSLYHSSLWPQQYLKSIEI